MCDSDGGSFSSVERHIDVSSVVDGPREVAAPQIFRGMDPHDSSPVSLLQEAWDAIHALELRQGALEASLRSVVRECRPRIRGNITERGARGSSESRACGAAAVHSDSDTAPFAGAHETTESLHTPGTNPIRSVDMSVLSLAGVSARRRAREERVFRRVLEHAAGTRTGPAPRIDAARVSRSPVGAPLSPRETDALLSALDSTVDSIRAQTRSEQEHSSGRGADMRTPSKVFIATPLPHDSTRPSTTTSAAVSVATLSPPRTPPHASHAPLRRPSPTTPSSAGDAAGDVVSAVRRSPGIARVAQAATAKPRPLLGESKLPGRATASSATDAARLVRSRHSAAAELAVRAAERAAPSGAQTVNDRTRKGRAVSPPPERVARPTTATRRAAAAASASAHGEEPASASSQAASGSLRKKDALVRDIAHAVSAASAAPRRSEVSPPRQRVSDQVRRQQPQDVTPPVPSVRGPTFRSGQTRQPPREADQGPLQRRGDTQRRSGSLRPDQQPPHDLGSTRPGTPAAAAPRSAEPFLVAQYACECFFILEQRLAAHTGVDNAQRAATLGSLAARFFTGAERTGTISLSAYGAQSPQERLPNARSSQGAHEMVARVVTAVFPRMDAASVHELCVLAAMAMKRRLLSLQTPADFPLVIFQQCALVSAALVRTAAAAAAENDQKGGREGGVDAVAAAAAGLRARAHALGCGAMQDIRHALLNHVEGMSLRVVRFVRDGVQTSDGTFVLPRGGPVPALPPVVARVGRVRYYTSTSSRSTVGTSTSGTVVTARDAFVPHPDSEIVERASTWLPVATRGKALQGINYFALRSNASAASPRREERPREAADLRGVGTAAATADLASTSPRNANRSLLAEGGRDSNRALRSTAAPTPSKPAAASPIGPVSSGQSVMICSTPPPAALTTRNISELTGGNRPSVIRVRDSSLPSGRPPSALTSPKQDLLTPSFVAQGASPRQQVRPGSRSSERRSGRTQSLSSNFSLSDDASETASFSISDN